MKRLEAEEQESMDEHSEQAFIDRQQEVPNQMGQEAVVVAGRDNIAKPRMTNSIVNDMPAQEGVYDPSRKTPSNTSNDSNDDIIEI